jgi:hypothetical protein
MVVDLTSIVDLVLFWRRYRAPRLIHEPPSWLLNEFRRWLLHLKPQHRWSKRRWRFRQIYSRYACRGEYCISAEINWQLAAVVRSNFWCRLVSDWNHFTRLILGIHQETKSLSAKHSSRTSAVRSDPDLAYSPGRPATAKRFTFTSFAFKWNKCAVLFI